MSKATHCAPPSKISRSSYTPQIQARIIEKYLEEKAEDENLSLEVFAEGEKISKSMLSRWLKDKGKIFKKVNEGCLLKKDRTSGKSEKHAKTQFLLYQKFLQQRKKGNKVSFKWLMLTGRKIAIENSHPTFTRWATQQYLRIYQVKIRRVQRKKQKPKSANEEALKQWHFNFREKVVQK